MLLPIKQKKILHQEYKRYARQIIIKEIGIQGQTRLKKARILCVGAGGLNSPVLLYLAACGIGLIGIIDKDTIEVSNLQRQILYKNNDVCKQKVKVAFNTLKNLNPNIIINSHNNYLTKQNIRKVISKYDIIIDGTDNFKIRYTISQYCYYLHKIHIYAAIEQFTGQISTFNYQGGAHYYNLYNNISNITLKSCSDRGLVNTIAGIIGSLQATEAIKIILGVGSILHEKLLICNILNYSFKQKKIKKNKITNRICIKSNQTSRNKYISFHDLEKNKEYLLIDVRTPFEFQINKLNKSVNIPLKLLKNEVCLTNIQKISPFQIILCCDNEQRSYIASKLLKKYNIRHCILEGGIQALRKERDSNPRQVKLE